MSCLEVVWAPRELFWSWDEDVFVTWDLANPAIINDTVPGVKSPMKHLVLVEVSHPAGDVGGKGQSVGNSHVYIWVLLQTNTPPPCMGCPTRPTQCVWVCVSNGRFVTWSPSWWGCHRSRGRRTSSLWGSAPWWCSHREPRWSHRWTCIGWDGPVAWRQ